jgi:hypothetical protein
MRLAFLDTSSREVIDRCIPDAERDAFTAASVLDFGMRAAKAGCGRIAAVLRMLGARVVFETHPTDVVWPVLRDYPYGPPAR